MVALVALGPKDGGMDAGLAAVLGALAGSTATIGAALATGWAQREGARITARSEHRRERREPRHGAYTEFISAASRMRAATGEFSFDASLTSVAVDEELVQRWYEVAMTIKDKSVAAALAGPQSVTEASVNVVRMSDELAIAIKLQQLMAQDASLSQRVREDARQGLAMKCREFTEALNEFVFRAQKALDDDGSRV